MSGLINIHSQKIKRYLNNYSFWKKHKKKTLLAVNAAMCDYLVQKIHLNASQLAADSH